MSSEPYPVNAPASTAASDAASAAETRGGASGSEHSEAKRYAQAQLKCDLSDRAIDLSFLAVVAVVFARTLDSWLTRHLGIVDLSPLARTAHVSSLFVLVTLLHIAVSFPLSFYSGYLLEHRFGMSRQRATRWLWQYTKRQTLALVLGVLLMTGLYWIIWMAGPIWWLLAALGFIAISVILGQLLPVLILPLFYKVQRMDNPELIDRLRRLARGTGLNVEGIYRIQLSDDTVKANAMLAGMGRTRRVILGDTLLEQLNPEEIEVVFAHELGHHVHRHLPKLIAWGALFSLISFFVMDRLLQAIVELPARPGAYAQIPVWTLPALMLMLAVLSMLFEPLQNAISRSFERQSDRYALARTANRQAFRSAFEKLALVNKTDLDPHPLEVWLFHSHPPIRERLELVEG